MTKKPRKEIYAHSHEGVYPSYRLEPCVRVAAYARPPKDIPQLALHSLQKPTLAMLLMLRVSQNTKLLINEPVKMLSLNMSSVCEIRLSKSSCDQYRKN